MIIVNLLGWLVFGLIVGAIARFLVPGRDPLGCVGTISVGVLGSIVGGLVAWALFRDSEQQFQPSGFIGALFGAILVLLVYRRIAPKQREYH